MGKYERKTARKKETEEGLKETQFSNRGSRMDVEATGNRPGRWSRQPPDGNTEQNERLSGSGATHESTRRKTKEIKYGQQHKQDTTGNENRASGAIRTIDDEGFWGL